MPENLIVDTFIRKDTALLVSFRAHGDKVFIADVAETEVRCLTSESVLGRALAIIAGKDKIDASYRDVNWAAEIINKIVGALCKLVAIKSAPLREWLATAWVQSFSVNFQDPFLVSQRKTPPWLDRDGGVNIQNRKWCLNFLVGRDYGLVQQRTGGPMSGVFDVLAESLGMPHAGSDWKV